VSSDAAERVRRSIDAALAGRVGGEGVPRRALDQRELLKRYFKSEDAAGFEDVFMGEGLQEISGDGGGGLKPLQFFEEEFGVSLIGRRNTSKDFLEGGIGVERVASNCAPADSSNFELIEVEGADLDAQVDQTMFARGSIKADGFRGGANR